MNRRKFLKLSGLFSASLPIVIRNANAKAEKDVPNIIFILADDMGYGDAGCYNPDSKIPTPHIDHLAEQSMRFTNAHSCGTLCVPARYGLLTGRYPFRTEIQKHYVSSLINRNRVTLGSLLQDNGYNTACIGKWHLGFRNIHNFNCNRRIVGGPVDRGFDYFFGLHASLDIPPYYYIENDQCVQPLTEKIPASRSDKFTAIQGEFWRAGKISSGFEHEEVMPTLVEKALSFLREYSQEQPFFLYFPLTAPHTPWLPTESFKDKSDAGPYGDFVVQIDTAIGKIMALLDETGCTENTIVFFSSDNGPVWFQRDVNTYDHHSTSYFKGIKSDKWEGGHRMPFIVRWPGKIAPGSVTDEIISFTDMLATFAAIVGDKQPVDAGEDSYNILPVLLGEDYEKPLREATVIENRTIIQGEWKLILGGGLGRVHAKYAPALQGKKVKDKNKNELYNIKEDPSETKNLYQERKDIVFRLYKLLEKYKKQGFSASRH